MSRSNDTTAASSRRAGPPAWILLDNNAFIDDLQNANSATAWTSKGQPIRGTLAAAEPPRDSYSCVHCPCLKKKRKHGETSARKRKHGDDDVFPPRVVYSDGDLALLSVTLSNGPVTDYFIYKAGRHPSLRLLPATCSDAEVFSYAPGLAHIGGDGEHFVVAGVILNTAASTQELHVFRSDRGTWTKTPLVLGINLYAVPTKAISLGGGDLGWVDLRQCIIVCNVLNDDAPNPRLIPLPKLLPSNEQDKHRRHPCEYREVRDVIVCADGSITCVEIEHCLRHTQLRDVSTADVLHDSDLPLGYGADTAPPKFEYLDWVITWNREANSTCWRKRGLVYADDILACHPGHTALLRPTAADAGAQSLTVRHLTMQVPSLSIHGGDVVYIMGKASPYDTNTKVWILTVDMAKRTLEEVATISTEQSPCPSYITCSLSKYLEN